MQNTPARATAGAQVQLRDAIKPFFDGGQPRNLILHAGAGTGINEGVMRLLKGFERSSRVKVVYVDCWRHSTRMAIYSLIARAIGEMLPRRGLARDEVFDRINEMMEKDGARVLLVLDGLEGLFHNGEERLLDDVCGKGKLFGVVGITGDARLHARVGTEFGCYEATQLDGKIFLEGVAERQDADDTSHASLSEEERIIIDIVKTGPKSSTDLYLAFSKRMQRSKRAIRNYVGRLESRQLLRVQTVAGVSPLLNTKRIELSSGMGAILAQDL
ncbi:MAG: hypothetical protein NTX79_05925 [Candidatus Micrarchaeota archaeon]|nr:hypothetical protein [Candidatus Micrarchaeota archaeon]